MEKEGARGHGVLFAAVLAEVFRGGIAKRLRIHSHFTWGHAEISGRHGGAVGTLVSQQSWVTEGWSGKIARKDVALEPAEVLKSSKHGATSGVMKKRNHVSQQSWVTGGWRRSNGEAQRMKDVLERRAKKNS